MRDLPEGFQVGELYCFPQGESGVDFAYVPGSPRIELHGDGRPAIGLLTSPSIAVLSTETVWSAEPAALDTVVQEIRARYRIPHARVRMAELSDATTSLTVRRPDGSGQTFGPQPTSGMEPHRAAFSEHVSTSDLDAVLAALRGRSGVLTIVYRATLIVHETVAAQIDGDLAEDLKALAPKAVEKKKPSLFGLGKQPEPTVVPAPDLAKVCGARRGRAGRRSPDPDHHRHAQRFARAPFAHRDCPAHQRHQAPVRAAQRDRGGRAIRVVAGRPQGGERSGGRALLNRAVPGCGRLAF